MHSPKPVPRSIKLLLNEHAELRAMLRSILRMLDRGPQDAPERFFDVLRAMLFYIDEFPERCHHPKESDFLFPHLLRLAPELFPTIEKLEQDHMQGESMVLALQHALIAWEMLGESRSSAFIEAARAYVARYLEHMQLEESIVLPAAAALLTDKDWKHLDTAFGTSYAPFMGSAPPHSHYDRLYFKIMATAPIPTGTGHA